VKQAITIHGRENGRDCRLRVEDNGIGFDEKYLDKIFQPFQRLHGKNEYSGVGIGLAICKKAFEGDKPSRKHWLLLLPKKEKPLDGFGCSGFLTPLR
jgi:light-regulated signal transduction histidine kinase (bacteriophytochrome)